MTLRINANALVTGSGQITKTGGGIWTVANSFTGFTGSLAFAAWRKVRAIG